MNTGHCVSSVRALWLITRLACRRQVNFWQSLRVARKETASKVIALELGVAAARTATPAKARGRSLFSIFILLMMALNGFNMASGGLLKLSDSVLNRVEPPSRKIRVSPYTALALADAENALKALQTARDPEERRRSETLWNEEINRLFRQEVQQRFLSDDDASAQVKLMHDTFAKLGASGFEASRALLAHTSSQTWPRDGEASAVFMRVLGLMVFLWILGTVFLSLGLNNRDLGKIEWNLEWLFTLPVSGRVLFASKLVEYTFLNAPAWVFFLPLLVMACIAGGHGWMSLGLGFLAFLWSLVLAGAGTTFCEVASRKFLSLTQLKNLQALSTVLGALLPLVALAVYMSKPVDDFLVMHAASWRWLDWSPFSLPLYLALPFATVRQMQLGILAMMAVPAIAVLAALRGSEFLTRDGLIRAAGPYRGTRKPAGAAAGQGWLRGIAAHELLLLARDRNLMAQVLFVPLLLPVFYLLVFSGLTTAVAGSGRHAAMLAFFIGAYAFMTSAMSILSREDKTLWFLMSFPQSVASIFLKKTLVWAAVGLVYGGATLLLVGHFGHHSRGDWRDAFFALYGIVLYAFIAAGIGILATNVLATAPRQRLRTDMVYLYMLLAGMWANTIYSFSFWTKLAQLVVTTLLAVALWQKVIDSSPYWLDPTERPPRTVSLADGLIAALAFFVVQSVGWLILHWVAPISLSAQLTLAYSFAGVTVGGLTLMYLWRQDIPDLWERIGLTREGGRALPLWRSVLQATAWGLVAALGAFVYLQVLKLFSEWEKWKENAELGSFLTRGDNPLWLCALVILAAPIFEEFLFRGLVLKGLLRSTGPTAAVVGSAALFALVHPPVSVVPVFALGIAAGLSFRKSGLLLAPIVTHAVYNSCVVFLNK